MVGLSAVLAVQTRANASLADKNTALLAANAKIEARYNLAVEAIKTFHTGVSEDFLLKEEKFKELRDRLLKSAADFYGRLGALLGKDTDIASRRALAQSNFELAELTAKVGDKGAALAAHRSVLAAREALAAEPGAEAGLAVDVVRSLTAVAGLLGQTGRTEEALAAYRRSESLLAGLTGSDPAARAALAASRTSLGWFLGGMGPQAEAMAVFKLARADLEALAVTPGASNDARRDLGGTIVGIGSLLWRTGKPAEAQAEYRTALALHQKLADDNPADTQSRLSWRSTTTTSASCFEYGQAGGGGGRVPQGGWRSPEAGRRQPRRHRIPPTAPGEQPHGSSVDCSPGRSDSPRRSPLWRPVWPFVRSWSTPIPSTTGTQRLSARVTPSAAGPESVPVNPPRPPPTCGGASRCGPGYRNCRSMRGSSGSGCWRFGRAG